MPEFRLTRQMGLAGRLRLGARERRRLCPWRARHGRIVPYPAPLEIRKLYLPLDNTVQHLAQRLLR